MEGITEFSYFPKRTVFECYLENWNIVTVTKTLKNGFLACDYRAAPHSYI